jgi:tetratricopeptide (TPR) repeat protein
MRQNLPSGAFLQPGRQGEQVILNRKHLLFVVTLISVQLMTTSAQLAFSNVTEGDVIGNMTLPTLYGDAAPLMADDVFNVFIFLKPVQQHSLDFIEDLAALEEEFKDKPVHWAAIVPDRFALEVSQAAIPDSALSMPILLDPGDKLYGELGVVLHPSIAITDADHVMLKYLHFHKVNFRNIIRAYLQHYLGEIDAQQLATALNPPAAVLGGDRAKASRSLKLAEKLFTAGKLEPAFKMATKSVDTDSTFADAHALKGEIQLAQGDRENARISFEMAITLDPVNEKALNGLKEFE